MALLTEPGSLCNLDSLYAYEHSLILVYSIHIPQLYLDMVHHHVQGKGKIPETAWKQGYSVSQSIQVVYEMESAYELWKHSPCNMMVTQSSLDT
jgi:hypothetical protein